MGIRFQCPNGHPLNVKSYLAGRRGVCPECAARFFVPTASGQPARSADQPQEATKPPSLATTSTQPEAPERIPLWYTRDESGQQFGPVETGVIRQWLIEGRVPAHYWVWRTGWPEWMRAGEAFAEMLAQPPALSPNGSTPDLIPTSAPPLAPIPAPISSPVQQPIMRAEPIPAGTQAPLPTAHRKNNQLRKKKRLRLTIWLALAVILLMVALLWVLLR